MTKAKNISAVAFILVFVFVVAMVDCAPPVSNSGCETLKNELDKANFELESLKTELDKVRAEAGAVKTASLEEVLCQRRSIRAYTDEPLTQDEVMKLLWAGQGITSARGLRTAPSAGAWTKPSSPSAATTSPCSTAISTKV